MTFFSKIFGKKEAIKAESPVIDTASHISRDLFIEDRDPEQMQSGRTTAREEIQEQSILDALLERDYADMGYKDGYRMHDLGRLEQQLEVIASDFRLAYDKALQDVELQLEQLGVYLTEKMEVEALDLYEKIQAKHGQLARHKKELLLQKDLAVVGEGYIERAVKYYRAGFREGFDFYIQEDLIFKHIKTL